MTIDDLISNCEMEQPQIIIGQTVENKLDQELRNQRSIVLKNIRQDAEILRKTAVDPKEALKTLETFKAQIDNLCLEPQCSIPDVIIWMVSDNERKAYARISPHLVFYSPNEKFRGKFCSESFTVFLKFPEENINKEIQTIPATLRIKMWLGLAKYEDSWTQSIPGTLKFFAETYENEVKIMNVWSSKMTTRPSFSDAQGKMKLKREYFTEPDGWKWVTEWFVNPDQSILYDKDSGRSFYIEEVFELQSRTVGGDWHADENTPWIDVVKFKKCNFEKFIVFS